MDVFTGVQRAVSEEEDFYKLLGCDETSTFRFVLVPDPVNVPRLLPRLLLEEGGAGASPRIHPLLPAAEEQIATEFKILARKCHPDKISDEEEKVAAEKRFMMLERARKVLLDKETRSKFDQWRSGGFCKWVSFDDWLSIHSRVHTSIHWASTQQKRPSIEGGAESASSSDEQKKTDSELDSSKTKTPLSLEEFRRSSEQTTILNRFRHYKV